MIRTGTKLRLHYGITIRNGATLGAGGEGVVYEAVKENTGLPGAYKVLKNGSSDKVKRTQFLVDQRLGELAELFCGPTDYYANGHVGHFPLGHPASPWKTTL